MRFFVSWNSIYAPQPKNGLPCGDLDEKRCEEEEAKQQIFVP